MPRPRENYSAGKLCGRCGVTKPAEQFYVLKSGRRSGRLSSRCKACNIELSSKRGLNSSSANMLNAAACRARRQGIPFSITAADVAVPEFCPVLGIRLKRNRGKPSPASPSIDKFVPSLGYVRGNIFIISHKANTLKGNGTLQEHEALVAWMRGCAEAFSSFVPAGGSDPA